MKRQPSRAPRPLGTTARKILLATALLGAKTGQAPTWTEVARACKIIEPRWRTAKRFETLRRRGLLASSRDEPRSTRITPSGYAEATGKRRG